MCYFIKVVFVQVTREMIQNIMELIGASAADNSRHSQSQKPGSGGTHPREGGPDYEVRKESKNGGVFLEGRRDFKDKEITNGSRDIRKGRRDFMESKRDFREDKRDSREGRHSYQTNDFCEGSTMSKENARKLPNKRSHRDAENDANNVGSAEYGSCKSMKEYLNTDATNSALCAHRQHCPPHRLHSREQEDQTYERKDHQRHKNKVSTSNDDQYDRKEYYDDAEREAVSYTEAALQPHTGSYYHPIDIRCSSDRSTRTKQKSYRERDNGESREKHKKHHKHKKSSKH